MSFSYFVEDVTSSGWAQARNQHGLGHSATDREQPRYISNPPTGLIERYGPVTDRIYCPNGRYNWLHLDTGELVSEYCRRNTCLACARRKATRISRAVHNSKPTTMLTITGLPTTWHGARDAMNAVTRYMRRAGSSLDWAYVVEENPSATGTHAHAFAKIDDERWTFPRALEHASLGLDSHDSPRSSGSFNAGYLFKEVRHNEASLGGFLVRNGGRLIHHTRTFLRTTDGAVRNLEDAVRQATPTSAMSRWVRVPIDAPTRTTGAAA